MKKPCMLAAILVVVSGAHAGIIDSQFANLDFDESTQSYFPGGFDAAAYDVPGWQSIVATDTGIEADAAWWGNYEGYTAFMASGNSGFNVSTYVIQSGDQFDLSFYAKSWSLAAKGWGADADCTLTMSLFYGGDTANIIGSFTTPVMTNSNDSANYVLYQATIVASPASVGQTLGVLAESAGFFANFDEISIKVIPEPGTIGMVCIFVAGMMFARRRFKR